MWDPECAAGAYHNLGFALNYAGRHKEAIAAYKKALRLNPNPQKFYFVNLAIACRDAGCYEKAIPICRKIVQQQPDFIIAHTCLATCYALTNREEEAQKEASEVLRIDPKFSVDHVYKMVSYKYDVDRKRLRDALLKAGLPH